MQALSVTIVIPTIGRQSLYKAVLSSQKQLGAFVKEIIISVDFKYKDVELHLPPQILKIPYKIVYGKEPGVANTLNAAIDNSQTELISWLSDDDIYTPIKILKQINYIFANKVKPIDYKRLFLLSNFTLCDLNTNITIEHNTKWMTENYRIEAGYFFLVWGLVSGCSVLFSKDLWSRAGKFPNDYKTTQDYVLWKRILDKRPIFGHTGRSGSITNIHSQMESRSLRDIHIFEKDTLLQYTFSGYLSSYQMHNLSLGDQRALYYAPPSDGPTFEPFLNNNNIPLRDLCELELQLNKWCFLIVNESKTKIFEINSINEFAHSVAKTLQENMKPFVGDIVNTYVDRELGYFLDSYYLDVNKKLIKICGIDTKNFSLTAKEKIYLVEEAIKNYRYVILLNLSESYNENSLNNLLKDLKVIDSKKEIFDTITIDSITLEKINNEFHFFVRNPFLANSNSLK
jgi:teichuronic acid biosynthesis glycosyltransferase TuaG